VWQLRSLFMISEKFSAGSGGIGGESLGSYSATASAAAVLAALRAAFTIRFQSSSS